jgi:hypothetical protein
MKTRLLATSSRIPVVTDDDAFLVEKAEQIWVLRKKVGNDLVAIGRHLTEVKERFPGRYGAWLQKEFAWSESTARNFVNVYELSKADPQRVADLNLPLRSLYLIAAPSTPSAARDEVADRAKNGERLNHEDIKAIIESKKSPAAAAVSGNDVNPQESAEQRKAEAAATEPKKTTPTSSKASKPSKAPEPPSIPPRRLTELEIWDGWGPLTQRHVLASMGAKLADVLPGGYGPLPQMNGAKPIKWLSAGDCDPEIDIPAACARGKPH